MVSVIVRRRLSGGQRRSTGVRNHWPGTGLHSVAKNNAQT